MKLAVAKNMPETSAISIPIHGMANTIRSNTTSLLEISIISTFLLYFTW